MREVIDCETESTPAIAADAERDAGDEDVEAGQAAAHFAQREAQGERQRRHAPRRRASCDGLPPAAAPTAARRPRRRDPAVDRIG